MCFINAFFKVITNLNFYQRPPSEAFLYHSMVSCANAPKEIHRLGPMDLKRTVTRQLRKSRDLPAKIISVTSISCAAV